MSHVNTPVCKNYVNFWENKKCLIREAFKLMDTDLDGYLNYQEAKVAMRVLGLTINKSFVLSIIHMYDKRGNNTICFDDFYYVVSNKLKEQDPISHIKYAFKIFTVESPLQKIRLEDLQRINSKIGSNLTTDEMRLMIKEFDTNHDDCIDEDEFIEIMTESVN